MGTGGGMKTFVCYIWCGLMKNTAIRQRLRHFFKKMKSDWLLSNQYSQLNVKNRAVRTDGYVVLQRSKTAKTQWHHITPKYLSLQCTVSIFIHCNGRRLRSHFLLISVAFKWFPVREGATRRYADLRQTLTTLWFTPPRTLLQWIGLFCFFFILARGLETIEVTFLATSIKNCSVPSLSA